MTEENANNPGNQDNENNNNADPAAGAEGQAPETGQGEEGQAEFYKPKGLPDHMLGKSDQETIDKLNTAYMGLRKELGKGKNIPDSPDAYEYDFGDMAEKILRPGEDGKDPVLSHMNNIFHAKGISNEDAQELVLELYKATGEVAAGGEADSEDAPDFEFSNLGGLEKAKPTIDAVSMWLKPMEEKGQLTDSMKDEISLMMTHGSGLEVLNFFRVQSGEEPIPKNVAQGSGGSSDLTEKDLQNMMRDPKYWRDKDPAYIQKVTEGFQKFYNNG